MNFVPQLVQRNWRDVFSAEFRDERTIQNGLWLIAEARNQVSRPSTQDLDLEYVRVILYHIADALGRINASEQRCAVEDIRRGLIDSGTAIAVTESSVPSENAQRVSEKERVNPL